MLEASTSGSTPEFDVEHAKLQLHQQDMAVKLFYAPGKQSFYLEDFKIQNLYDLKVVLDRIPENEAKRLADWLEYLGDEALAKEIYLDPTNFRNLILKRYYELTSCFTSGNSNDHGE
jgi:hypothetical protein